MESDDDDLNLVAEVYADLLEPEDITSKYDDAPSVSGHQNTVDHAPNTDRKPDISDSMKIISQRHRNFQSRSELMAILKENCDFSTRILAGPLGDPVIQYVAACRLCSYTFKSDCRYYYKLYDHVQSVHFEIKYPCSACSKWFPTRSSLNMHKRVVHSGVEFRCNICNHVGIYRQNMINHVKKRHLDFNRPGDHIYRVAKLLPHADEKDDDGDDISDSKPIVEIPVMNSAVMRPPVANTELSLCPSEHAASAADPSQNESDEDMTSYLDDNSECFTQIVVSRTGVKSSEYVAKCKICFKSFKLSRHYPRAYLHDHIRSVHLRVAFQCSMCSKKFLHRSSLADHTKSVHDGVRFRCNVCNYIGKKHTDVSDHVRSCHSIVQSVGDHVQKIFKLI